MITTRNTARIARIAVTSLTWPETSAQIAARKAHIRAVTEAEQAALQVIHNNGNTRL